MQCLNCQHDCVLTALVCPKCGVLLDTSRISYHRELALAARQTSDRRAVSQQLEQMQAAIDCLPAAEQRSYAITLHYLHGWLHYEDRRFAQAGSELELAARKLEASNDQPKLLADTLCLLGGIAYFEQRDTAATSYFQRAIEVAAAADLTNLHILALWGLAGVLLSAGAVAAAASLYQRTVGLAAAAGDYLPLARSHRLLARLYANYGPYSLARQHASLALSLRSHLHLPGQRARILAECAAVLLHANELALAEVYLHEARDLIAQSQDRTSRQITASGIVELLWQRDYQPWFGLAVMILEQTLADVLLDAEPAYHLARYYISQRDWAQARRTLLRLATIAQEQVATLGNLDRAWLTRTQAIIHSALGETEQAMLYFRQTINPGVFPPFEHASVLVEYAFTMLHAEVQDTNYQHASKIALYWAADLFRQLELPHRSEQIQAVLAELPDDAL